LTQKLSMFSRIYRTQQCLWCRKRFEDQEEIYYTYTPDLKHLWFCENCRSILEFPPDFDPNGSTEPCSALWGVAHILTLWRDDSKCRICGVSYNVKNPIEVHHIIPKKAGGSNSLKNLITLCQRHHHETYTNDYAGLEITEYLINQGIQKSLPVQKEVRP